MGAKQSVIVKQLEDFTECSICLKSFSDPRSLPCVHTFCLKCVESYCHGKKTGDEIPCPICRTVFSFPETGPSGIPKNFFIEHLLLLKQTADKSSELLMTCEVCEASNTNSSTVSATDAIEVKATTYCTECEERQCDDCAKSHKNFKFSRSHQQVKIEDYLKFRSDDKTFNGRPTVCEKHAKQTLSIYCCDCQLAVCVICGVANHDQHKKSDLNEEAEKFKKQMSNDVTSLTDDTSKLKKMLNSVEQQKTRLGERISVAESLINKTADEMKTIVEKRKEVLIAELTIKKTELLKQVENVSQEIQQHLSFVENLAKYTDELSSKGAASEITQQACGLHNRASQLLKHESFDRSLKDLTLLDAEFTPSKVVIFDNECSIGKVSFEKHQL